MQVKKESRVTGGGKPTAMQLEAINALARTELTEDQVYVFSLRLCDDQVDRDYERFDTAALPVLAKLFVGKTGIVDHQWSSRNQVARIFAAEVAAEEGISYLKAWAYIPRGGEKDGVIADIETGIKKEVSIGCAMGRSVCSICGSDYGSCGHQKGQHYDGQLCCAILREPMDAYEFSFVAVPAQREAGVLKKMGATRCLKDLAEEFGAQEEYRLLFSQAQLGQQYRKELEEDVVRLCLSLDLGAEAQVYRDVAKLAKAEDLKRLRDAMEGRLEQMLPVVTQLSGGSWEETEIETGFLI